MRIMVEPSHTKQKKMFENKLPFGWSRFWDQLLFSYLMIIDAIITEWILNRKTWNKWWMRAFLASYTLSNNGILRFYIVALKYGLTIINNCLMKLNYNTQSRIEDFLSKLNHFIVRELVLFCSHPVRLKTLYIIDII